VTGALWWNSTMAVDGSLDERVVVRHLYACRDVARQARPESTAALHLFRRTCCGG